MKVNHELRYIGIMDKLYTIFGYMNTGSGSLTYPEDFDGPNDVYEDKLEAQLECEKLQWKSFKDYDVSFEEGQSIEDIIDQVGCDTFMVFEVCEVKFHPKK